MILYTPMQLELVLEGLDQMTEPVLKMVEINGVPVLVEDEGAGRGKLVKLLSTDPQDYLNSNLAPGTLVNLGLAAESTQI